MKASGVGRPFEMQKAEIYVRLDTGLRLWSGLHGHGGCSQRGSLQFPSWQEQSYCSLLSRNINKDVCSPLIFTTKQSCTWNYGPHSSSFLFFLKICCCVCPRVLFLFKNLHALLPRRAGMVLNDFGKWSKTVPDVKGTLQQFRTNRIAFMRIPGKKGLRFPECNETMDSNTELKCHMSDPETSGMSHISNILLPGVKYLLMLRRCRRLNWHHPASHPTTTFDPPNSAFRRRIRAALPEGHCE